MNNKAITNPARTMKENIYGRDFPVATFCLVALNLILFFGTRILGDPSELAGWYGLIPDDLQFTRLLTAIFLHTDFVHLGVNIVFLWVFGRRVERAIGPIEYLLFYLGSGLVASLLHVAMAYAFLPDMLRTPVLGSSGAISGVLGIYAVWFRRDTVTIFTHAVSSASFLLVWLLFQAILGILGIITSSLGPIDLLHVGYWSHIGGFVFGMAAGWLTQTRDEKRDDAEVRMRKLRKRTLLSVAQEYQSLVQVNPNEPMAYAELGRVHALLEDQPSSSANYLQAIGIYIKNGKNKDALKTLKDMGQFWSNSALSTDVVFRCASYFETLGEYNDAADGFAWLVAHAENDPTREMALLKLGQIQLDKFNRVDEAAQLFQRLVNEFPESRWSDVARRTLSQMR